MDIKSKKKSLESEVKNNKKGEKKEVSKNFLTKNFWTSIKRPIFALAPMADVTDIAFRTVINKYSKKESEKTGKGKSAKDFSVVLWTEFVSADGLCSSGRAKLMHILKYAPAERPIVAQIFSANPDKIREASEFVAKLGFDGIDINMGCPDKAVEKQGAGASLIKNPELARALIRAAREGVRNAFKKKDNKKTFKNEDEENKEIIPISVKTRIGYSTPEVDKWIRAILEEKPACLTIHARTRKEMSDVPARWEFVAEAVKLRNEISPETVIIGNGDVTSVEDGLEKIRLSGADGAMVGRGIFGKPWFFNTKMSAEMNISKFEKVEGKYDTKTEKKIKKIIEKRIDILIEHIKLFEKHLSVDKNFAVMKKHFKAYINGWEGAKELRNSLMQIDTAKEAIKILKDYANK